MNTIEVIPEGTIVQVKNTNISGMITKIVIEGGAVRYRVNYQKGDDYEEIIVQAYQLESKVTETTKIGFKK